MAHLKQQLAATATQLSQSCFLSLPSQAAHLKQQLVAAAGVPARAMRLSLRGRTLQDPVGGPKCRHLGAMRLAQGCRWGGRAWRMLEEELVQQAACTAVVRTCCGTGATASTFPCFQQAARKPVGGWLLLFTDAHLCSAAPPGNRTR